MNINCNFRTKLAVNPLTLKLCNWHNRKLGDSKIYRGLTDRAEKALLKAFPGYRLGGLSFARQRYEFFSKNPPSSGTPLAHARQAYLYWNSSFWFKEFQEWSKQGQSFLRQAEIMYENKQYNSCAYFCQQAVEMHLKAFYIHLYHKPAPQIHYLTELGSIVTLPELTGLRTDQKSLAILGKDYMKSRYVDKNLKAPCDIYTKKDAIDRLSKAHKIRRLVQKELKGENE